MGISPHRPLACGLRQVPPVDAGKDAQVPPDPGHPGNSSASCHTGSGSQRTFHARRPSGMLRIANLERNFLLKINSDLLRYLL